MKNEPVCMCKVGVSDFDRRGAIWVRVGEAVWNNLKGDGIDKKGRKTQFLKRGQAGSRGECLKKGVNLITNYAPLGHLKAIVIKDSW